MESGGTVRAVNADTIRIALACSDPRCACRRPRTRATHCPAHPDRRPSLGVDERGGRVFVICRAGCPQDAVIEALRGRGLWSAAPPRPVRPRSLLAEARARVLAEARRQRERLRLEACRPLNVVGDFLRRQFQAVAAARRVATAKGDMEQAWDLLAKAARVEAEALGVESELDALLPLPWQADLDAPLGGGRPG